MKRTLILPLPHRMFLHILLPLGQRVCAGPHCVSLPRESSQRPSLNLNLWAAGNSRGLDDCMVQIALCLISNLILTHHFYELSIISTHFIVEEAESDLVSWVYYCVLWALWNAISHNQPIMAEMQVSSLRQTSSTITSFLPRMRLKN